MPRALVLCFTIVAAIPASLEAAPPIADEAAVSAEVSAVARTLGLDPPHDRARFISEFARLLYTPPFGRSTAVAALINHRLLDPDAVAAERAMRVPVPLTAEIWGRAIFKRTIRPDDLIVAIMVDRRAALLCYGLAGLDDETLGYLAQHLTLLTQLYEHHAAAFAAFGGSFRVHADRIAPPGGESAVALWEAVLRQSAANPEAFARALFSMHDARVAYLYDAIAQLEEQNAAFVLGNWMTDPATRVVRFTALVEICSRGYREWRLETLPFSRPLHDLAMLFMRLRPAQGGTLPAPSSRAFWSAAFGSDELNVDAVNLFPDPAADQQIDAAWLAETTSGSDMFWRGDRIDQFAFGQRLFTGAPASEWPAAVVAIRAFPRQRMLSLTLERMGIRTPAVYASIARQAQRLTSGSPTRQFRTLGQLQAAVALVARMTAAGTLTPAAGERLVVSVFNLPVDGDRYLGAVATWLRRELLPLLPPAPETTDARDLGAIETRLMAGLAGPDPGPSAPRVKWEGQRYRLDLAAGERQRLHMIRHKQEGYSVDVAMALDALARALAAEGVTIDKVRQAAAELASFPETFDRRLDTPGEPRAPGVEEPRPAREWIEKFGEDLARSVRGNDVKRAARLTPAMLEIVDDVLTDALMSLAYAADLGDTDGAAMLARNVALRHDFGFGRKDTDVRARSVWAVPRQDFLPGVPWHVTGSLLGLDIAMASLSLKRVSPDQLALAPRLPSNERDAFAIGVALMNARLLLDTDRDAIRSAIGRGTGRVADVAAGREPLDPAADALGMDGWRRRAISWMLTEDREAIPSMFSLAELLTLGGGLTGVNLDLWGTTALQSESCACTRLTLPRTWRLLSGRPQMAFMASGIPDLNLHIAATLADLRLPASLTRHALAAAVLDFVEEVGPTDPNDWWSLARAAQAVPIELVEDYVAAAAAVDGPLVPDDTGTTHQP